MLVGRSLATESELVEELSIIIDELVTGPVAQGHLAESPEQSCALPQQTVQSFGLIAEDDAGGIILGDWVLLKQQSA